MPAWPSETLEDPTLDPLVVPTTAPDNPKPQRPQKALFRNRPSCAKRCWTPDAEKNRGQSKGAGEKKDLEKRAREWKGAESNGIIGRPFKVL
jgi:hypothetical protein